jgi:hypothetical protein
LRSYSLEIFQSFHEHTQVCSGERFTVTIKLSRLILGLGLGLFGLVACLPPPLSRIACVDFEPPLALGTEFGTPGGHNPGDTAFTTNNITVRVWDFEFIGGGGTFNVATIEPAKTSPTSFGSGQIIRPNNINLEFDFSGLGFQVAQVELKYLDLGGYENLSINGSSPTYIGDLSAASSSVPGISVSVSATPVTGGTTGILTVTGAIKTIKIGGQELWIDEVCAIE